MKLFDTSPELLESPANTSKDHLGVGNSFGWDLESLQRYKANHFRDLYVSEAVLEHEAQKVFGSSWLFAGVTDELPESGSFITLTVLGVPLAIVNQGNGQLKCFRNICSHRGMTLLSGSGKLGTHMTCQYHQWSFNREGDLVRIPQPDQFLGIELSELSLGSVAVEVWHEMIFVRMSEYGQDFLEWISEMEEHLGAFLDGPLVEVGKVQYSVNCNWKFLVENHLDVYHLWYLHAKSLNAFDHRSFEWESLGDNWWSYEPLKVSERNLGGLPWIPDRDRVGIGAHLLFPNLMMVTTGDYFATYDAYPISPNETRITLRLRAELGTDGERLISMVRSFLAEDIVACEALQSSTGYGGFAVGPLASTHERPLRNFHRSLRRHSGKPAGQLA